MKTYYVNDVKQDNGDYEVHHEHCRFLPSWQNRTLLGKFSNCRDAVIKAKTIHKKVNGCYYCSNDCHTQ